MPSIAAVRVFGVDEAKRTIGNLAEGVRGLAGLRVRAMSRLPYAQGIRTGYYRNGRLARRAGGTFAVDKARTEVVAGLAGEVAAALPLGPAAAQAVVMKGAQQIVEIVQQTEAIKSGNLRASYHVERG